ncbi:DUF563 domain protein [Aspergillus stella-maris]|uniref:DUF563 domain protein n=1 Tax=Aspergillus stella-maris TaxID=1810926 RepID=UPI003CCD419E
MRSDPSWRLEDGYSVAERIVRRRPRLMGLVNIAVVSSHWVYESYENVNFAVTIIERPRCLERMSYAKLSGLRLRFLRIGATTIILFLVLSCFAAFRSPFAPDQTQPLHSEPESAVEFGLPPEYAGAMEPPRFCADRFGASYLRRLRDSATEYCTSKSPGRLTCFHSKTTSRRVDSFCFARGALFKGEEHRFSLACDLRDLDGLNVPKCKEFANYWYDTRQGRVLDKAVRLDGNTSFVPTDPVASNYTMLVEREGVHNVWHSLLEIISMTLSLDVLRMTKHLDGAVPILADHDLENTQVLILDNKEEGPYFDLWSLLTGIPTI